MTPDLLPFHRETPRWVVRIVALAALLCAATAYSAPGANASVAASSPTAQAPVVAVSSESAPVAATAAVVTSSSTDTVAGPEVVDQIEFIGNVLNKSRSLAKKIKTKKKQTLDRRKLNADVKILFETHDFDDVTVAVTPLGSKDADMRDRVRVTFTVSERAIIKRIDYKGNKQIHTTSFSEKVQSKEGDSFDRYKAALDERSILDYYRDEGYAGAKVEHYTTVDQKKRELILTFFIVEGERIIVKNIEIEGGKKFSEKSLKRKLKTRRKKTFKEELLKEDEKKLTEFYRNHGFLDVEVSSPEVVIDKERNLASIKFKIVEGEIYKVGTINFKGSTIFSEKELRKALALKSKRLYQQSKLDESIANINALYADKGYLRTEVAPRPDRNSGAGVVNFLIEITESSVVYVDGVYVDGNTYTKSYVIKREVLLKSGDVFSASRMRRSVERIYNLGFLDDVNVDVQQPRDPDLADIIFSVKEGKPGVFSAGAGFSSVDKFVGSLQVQHTNLFGRAQRVNVLYEFGARRQNFDVGWTDPWFLGYNMSGGVDVFNTLRIRDFPGAIASFQEQRRGASFRIGPRISDDTSLLFAYTLQTTRIFGVVDSIKTDLFPTFGIPQEEAPFTDSVSQVKSSMLTEISNDTRDNKFDATRGARNSASVELAGGPYGGDINYYKPQIETAVYFPTFWKFVFTVSGKAAWVNKFSPSKDVPSSERFFLGGPDTIRGYDTNSIVPRDRENIKDGTTAIHQIPGRILTLFNAEYKFPIVEEHNRTIFQGAFFLDVGGTWLRTSDIDFRTGATDNRMKAGAGFGFRFKTPVFPIRLDFGIPLTPRKTDGTRQGDSHTLQPYFTIGNIF